MIKAVRKKTIILIALLLCFILFSAACSKSGAEKETEEGWGETQSISVATDWAGIDFQSPDETFILDDGRKIELTTYRYRTGIVEALYSGDDHEIVFRRSDTLQGADLAGEDRSYPKEWDTELNGISIHCLGNGSGINAAYFDKDNDHYSVTCHLGDGDTGLTEEELSAFLEPVFDNGEEDDDAAEMYQKGRMYDYGEGVEQDYEKAAEWYLKAAGFGNAKAEEALGYLYFNGLGVEQDYAKSFEWYSKAAEQGDKVAEYMIGVMYQNGYEVEQDYAKALEYFYKSAEQGQPDAEYAIGLFYNNGFGVELDHLKASEWYLKAAEHGLAAAQNDLGVLYDEGLGVEQDDEKAKYWYTQAAEQGLEEAKKNLEEMAEEQKSGK